MRRHVCVCVWEVACLAMPVCVCVCVRARETRTEVSSICLFVYCNAPNNSYTWLCSMGRYCSECMHPNVRVQCIRFWTESSGESGQVENYSARSLFALRARKKRTKSQIKLEQKKSPICSSCPDIAPSHIQRPAYGREWATHIQWALGFRGVLRTHWWNANWLLNIYRNETMLERKGNTIIRKRTKRLWTSVWVKRRRFAKT